MVERGTEAAGGVGGSFDFGVVITEHERAVSAHEVDELVAIHIVVTATVAGCSEVGHRARNGGGGRGVPVNTAGNHSGGAAEEGLGVGEIQTERRRFFYYKWARTNTDSI